MATFVKYQKFVKTQLNGGQDTTGASANSADRVIDFNTDTIKVALVTSSYTPSASGHATFADIGAVEVSGTGYTAGGLTLSGVSLTETGGVATFDADDVVISQSGVGFTNARYAIIYKDSGTPNTSTLLVYSDLGADRGNVAGDLSLQWNALGILDVE